MTHEPTTPAPNPGTPAGGASALQSAHRLDLGIVGAGVIIFIASMLPFYTFGPVSISAWHGFFGWFGVLCAMVGSGILAAHLMAVTLPIPARLSVLGAYGLGLLCLFIALFVTPGGGLLDLGHGFGYWLAFLVAIAGTALAFLRKDEA